MNFFNKFPFVVVSSIAISITPMQMAIALPSAEVSNIAQLPQSLPASVEDYYNRGDLRLQQGLYKAAIGDFEQAIRINSNYAEAYLGRGVARSYLGYSQEAIEDYTQAIKLNPNLVAAYYERGYIYIDLGDYQRAIEDFDQVLNINPDDADAYHERGYARLQRGDYEEAINDFNKTIDIEPNHPQAYNSRGIAYRNLGDYQQALKDYDQAIRINPNEAIYYNNRAIVRLYLGDEQGENNDFQQAFFLAEQQNNIDFYLNLLAHYRKIGDREAEGLVCRDIGNIYLNIGQYAKALKFHYQALEIHRKFDLKGDEILSLYSLGSIYLNLGQETKALDFFEQSLDIIIGKFYTQAGEQIGENFTIDDPLINIIFIRQEAVEGKVLTGLGVVKTKLGQETEALKLLQRALALHKLINDKEQEGITLSNIGSVYNNLGQEAKALEFFEQALALHRKINDKAAEGITLSNIGSVYNNLGQEAKALEFFEQALALHRKINDKAAEARTLNNIGTVYNKLGRYTDASRVLFAAIEIKESLRSELSDTDRVSLFETQDHTYAFLQQTLVAQNDVNTALETAERGRTRALVELLRQGSSPQSDAPLPIKHPSLKEIQQIAQQQNATLVEYSIVFNELYIWVILPTGKIEFRAVELPQDKSLEELVTNGRACILQDQCRGDTNQTPTIGDLVKLKDDQFDEPWQVVDIQQDTLTLRLENWEEGTTIQRPITDVVAIVNAFNRKRLQQLHQLLIQPIANLLPKDENERVIFIPHQQLFLVPFPALQDEAGNYLIEKHTILTAPSIEVLNLTRQQRQNLPDSVQGALVVGNPTMPSVTTKAGEPPKPLSNLLHAETEAIEIAPLLNTQPITGNSATKAAILPKLPQARIIHLATHGLLDDFKGLGVPGAIALAPSGTGELNDGLLTAGELLQMKLNAELVVLSACKTGQGDITSDGVIGLSRSLVAAGVPSIIVSLWSVPDAPPTVELMTRFYQNLDTTDDKAQALRMAMLDTMKEHPNPRNWAAFTLIGEAF